MSAEDCVSAEVVEELDGRQSNSDDKMDLSVHTKLGCMTAGALAFQKLGTTPW